MTMEWIKASKELPNIEMPILVRWLYADNNYDTYSAKLVYKQNVPYWEILTFGDCMAIDINKDEWRYE